MHDDGVDARHLHQHDILREILRHAAFHGVAAIFHDDGAVLVLQDVGQGFDQNARGLPPAREHTKAAFRSGSDVVLKGHGSFR